MIFAVYDESCYWEAAAVPTTAIPTAAVPTTGVPTTAPDPHLRAKSAPDSTYRKRRDFQGGRNEERYTHLGTSTID